MISRRIRRNPNSHKGDNGRVLIVGGSEDYVGCLVLAGRAAFAAGADIVTIAAPEKVAWAINTLEPDFMTRKLKGKSLRPAHFHTIESLAGKHDLILLGTGMGLRSESARLANSLARLPILKVIDADGLKVLKLKGLRNSILTPHARELEILAANNKIKLPRLGNTSLLAAALRPSLGNNVLLLKGKTDVIISREVIEFNRTGNCGMTKAGTGDVLAGLCAAFYSQEKDAFKAACRAACVNGKAGDALLRRMGYAFTASDLIDALPQVLKKEVWAL